MPQIRILSTPDELDRLFSASGERPVWLFKHSLTCWISDEARREFEQFVADSAAEDHEFALLEIQRVENLSQAVAERTGVRHESPQALLIRDGKAAWTASHWSITAEALAAATC